VWNDLSSFICDDAILIIKEPLIITLFKRSVNIIVTNQMDLDFINPKLMVETPTMMLRDADLNKSHQKKGSGLSNMKK
jgi:hypothetical protein